MILSIIFIEVVLSIEIIQLSALAISSVYEEIPQLLKLFFQPEYLLLFHHQLD